MSWIDTLLTENSTATVILIDRNLRPGGHWVHAYPFVTLHQPSCYYGVNSLPLAKTRDSRGLEIFDCKDLATASDIVKYYERVLDQFKACGRVRFFFGAEYKQEDPAAKNDASETSHTIVTHGGEALEIRCSKLVTVATNVIVPSMRKPLIPVHDDANFIPVNDLPDAIASNKYNKYVVLGAGKTGIDAVLELLKKGVDQSHIKWVISRDVFYFIRDKLFEDNYSYKTIANYCEALIEANTSKDAMLGLEKRGFAARLIPDGPYPEVFKAPTVDAAELVLLRTVKDLVRSGRVLSIEADEITLEREQLSYSSSKTVFVDCMVDSSYGWYDLKEDFTTFEPNRINLGPFLSVFNPSFTSALVAYIESTFLDDEIKNSLCFFLSGKYATTDAASYIGLFYAQLKTSGALRKVHPSSSKFMLSSRTNYESLNISGRSLPKLMWAAYGPLQLSKFGSKLIQKIDGGGYSDIDHKFGIGRPMEIRPKPKVVLRKKDKKTQGPGAAYPPPRKVTKSGWARCCTIFVIFLALLVPLLSRLVQTLSKVNMLSHL